MPGNLTIMNVSLSKRRRSLPDPMDGHRDVWFDVIIDVENSGDKPLYVIDELRSITFHAATRVLWLRLSEPPAQPVQKDSPVFHLPPPRTVTVEPRAALSIVVEVPAILKELRFGSGLVPTIEQTDITAMQTIRCEVASSERPIEHRGAETAYELRTRLQTWGKVVSKDTPVKPDMRNSPAKNQTDGSDPDQSPKR
jgi:hypothetical protein